MMLTLQLSIDGDGPSRTVVLEQASPRELVDALRAKARDLEREYGLAGKACAYGHPLEQ